MLESVQGLPFRDVVTFDLDGTVYISGKKLDTDQSIRLREGIVSLSNNQAYKAIKEQIAYEAVKLGVNSSLSMDMVLMSKSALWLQEQEKRLVAELSGE